MMPEKLSILSLIFTTSLGFSNETSIGATWEEYFTRVNILGLRWQNIGMNEFDSHNFGRQFLETWEAKKSEGQLFEDF